MKPYLCIIVAVLFLALPLTACDKGATSTALSVNDLRSDPGAFTGTLAVTGIMAAVSQQDPQIFGIMDKAELTCQSPNCKKFYLPVRFTGQRPAQGDEVVVTGSFIDADGGKIFAATAVDVMRNHKL